MITLKENLGLLAVFVLWSGLELLSIWIFVSRFLNLPRKDKVAKEITVKTIIYAAILLGDFWLISRGFIEFAMFVSPLMLVKAAIILSAFYKMGARSYAYTVFLVVLSSFIGMHVHLFTPFLPWIEGQIGSYLCEVAGEILLLLILSVLIFLRKKRILSFHIADLSVADLLIFALILYTAGIWEAGIFGKIADIGFTLKAVFGIMILGVVVMIARSIIMLDRKKTLEDANYLLEEQIGNATDYYNQLAAKDNATRKFRHDIKNLLLGLHGMIKDGRNDKALEYIEELEGMCDSLKPKFGTGNFIADTILAAKDTKASKTHTAIDFEGAIPMEGIRDVDMVVVLSNLLDNAIEACERLEGDKRIRVKSILKKNIWVLNVENPSAAVKIEGNRVATTKSDAAFHGFGLANIERAAAKYGGNLRISYEEGLFRANVSFMIN